MTKERYTHANHSPDYEDLRCCCFRVRRIENKYGKYKVMSFIWIFVFYLVLVLGLIMTVVVNRHLSSIPPDELNELNIVCNQLLNFAIRNSTGERYCQLQKEFFERYNSMILWSSIFYMVSSSMIIFLLGYFFCFVLPMMMALIQNNYEDITLQEED